MAKRKAHKRAKRARGGVVVTISGTAISVTNLQGREDLILNLPHAITGGPDSPVGNV